MSRNLCQVECHRCKRERVTLEETPRPITEAEARRYFDEYRGMLVANATCPRCDARYLAWVRMSDDYGHRYGSRPSEQWCVADYGYFDLSYRSTFNDEPGPEDLPKPRILDELDRDIGLEGHAWLDRPREMLAEFLGWKDG